MVLHRQQAQFVRAKWRMVLLLPCWVLQMLLMLAMIGVFSYRLSNTIQKYDDDEKEGKIPAVELVWEITGIAFPLVGVALTIFEIVKMVAETLTPWTMLFTHVLKIVTSCASLAVDIVMYIEHKDRHYSLIGLAMDATLILIILVPGIYAIRTYRRLASFDDYHHPANAKNFGYTDLEQQQQQQQAKGSRLSIGGASLRRLSSSSVTNAAPAEHDPVSLGDLGRTPSYYNNERDTQFDKYMIDRAMSTEFSNGAGFGAHSPGTHSPPNRSGSTATDASSAASVPTPMPTPGIVISAGTMPSAKALRDSMGRTPSWGSSHVLVAVPEADEEMADGHGGHRQSADREALLGPRTRSVSGASDASRGGRFRDEARGSFEEYDLGERKRKWNP